MSWVRVYCALGPATKTAVAIAGPTDLIICLLTCYDIVLMSNLYDLIGRNKDYFTLLYFTLLWWVLSAHLGKFNCLYIWIEAYLRKVPFQLEFVSLMPEQMKNVWDSLIKNLKYKCVYLSGFFKTNCYARFSHLSPQ